MKTLRLSLGTTIIILSLLLSSCSHPLKNSLGNIVIPDHRIAVTAGREQTWQTKDLVLHYTLKKDGHQFLITGTVSINDRIHNSYPITKSLNVYVNLLDRSGAVTSIQDLGLLFPAYSQVNKSLPFTKQLPGDEDVSSIAFSYWGTFRQSGMFRGDGDELFVYHNPFQK